MQQGKRLKYIVNMHLLVVAKFSTDLFRRARSGHPPRFSFFFFSQLLPQTPPTNEDASRKYPGQKADKHKLSRTPSWFAPPQQDIHSWPGNFFRDSRLLVTLLTKDRYTRIWVSRSPLKNVSVCSQTKGFTLQPRLLVYCCTFQYSLIFLYFFSFVSYIL